jgi:multidrug efflux pump subunit AcrA (membrane-fusion protein)
MPLSVEAYQQLAQLDEKTRSAILQVASDMEKNLAQTVRREDFTELKSLVADITLTVKELAEAQKRTEARVEELAEAQKRTEARVEELAEAQKRTEARVEELAKAQQETQKEVSRLDRALQELAEVVKTLVAEVSDIKKQLGGLAMTVGYGLEDKLYPHIGRFVRRTFGIEAQEIARKNVVYTNGDYDEVNIYVAGIKNGRQVLAVGECKSQPGKKDVHRFDAMIKRLQDKLGLEVYPFLVGYTFSPEVEKFIREQYPFIQFYRTYEIEYGE